MDNKNRNQKASRLPFNIVDLFILILVLAFFVGIILRIGNFTFSGGDSDLSSYRIQFSVTDIAESSVDHFKTADTVTVAGSGAVLGRIEMINTVEPTTAYVKNADGEIVLATYPVGTRVDVTGSVIAKGKVENNCFMLGGTTRITPGDSFSVKTEHMDFVLTVLDIAKK